MEDLERQLREALQREEPSADFRAKVMTRVNEGHGALHWWAPLRWVAVAAVVVAVAGVPIYERRERERQAEGEAARRQVEMALHIAGAKMQLVKTELKRAGERTREKE